MKRFVASLASFCLLLAPTLSSAAVYNTPSELLRAVEFNGQPRVFDMEGHIQNADMYVSVWVKGGMEGVQADSRLKLAATIDVHEMGQTMRAKGELRVLNNTLYLKLIELGNLNDETSLVPEEMDVLGQWYSLDIPADDMQSNDEMMNEFLLMLASEGIDMSVSDIDAFSQEMLDALFTMQPLDIDNNKDNLTDVTVYKLKLYQDFMQRLLPVVERVLIELGESTDGFPSQAEMETIQSIVNEHVILDFKVDTTPDGIFQFARFTLALDIPTDFGQDFKVNVTGTTEAGRRQVVAPVDPTPLETLGVSPFDMLGSNGWDWEDEGWEDDWDEDEWNSDDWEDMDDWSESSWDDWDEADEWDTDWNNWSDDEADWEDEWNTSDREAKLREWGRSRARQWPQQEQKAPVRPKGY